MRGNLVWDIHAFVHSKAGLTKEVVFHEDGLSKEVLLYYYQQSKHNKHLTCMYNHNMHMRI